VGDFIEIRDE
jgi:phospholipid-translocating ATPase